MHNSDRLTKEHNVTKYSTVDLIRLVQTAAQEIGDNREITVEKIMSDLHLSVKLRAY